MAADQDEQDDWWFHRRERGGEGVYEDLEQSCSEIHVSVLFKGIVNIFNLSLLTTLSKYQ